MGINFKEVGLPVEESYVKPGFWRMAPVDAKLTEKSGSTPFLTITFEGKAGKLSDKFYLSDKASSKLQYLHFGLYNKMLEKDFNTLEMLEDYFNKLFKNKRVELNLVVGGQIGSNGKIYSSLPFSKFIVSEEDFKEGAFEKDSEEFKEFVKISNTPSSNDVLLSTSSKVDSSSNQS